MRFAKEQGIPAQGRGSATSSIVSYTLGISRVEPIAHNLLFERFINPGRTTYPDVDIDFSSERREEVIQYVYERYGPEHTGMVCNLVTYRARSAVREVGYALGFPRPLVDRVAKALETYDSVMVRRDLEADGGFAEFFQRPGEGLPAEAGAAEAAEALGFVDGMGQLNTRMPLVGKVPPWRQPPKPEDPTAPRPFAWLRETDPTAVPGGAGEAASEHRSERTPRCVSEERGANARLRRPAQRYSGMWEEAPESPPVDPAGRPDRRRRWSGRHPGQRRLAAGGSRDGLQGGRGSAGRAAAHRRPAGRSGERPARAAAAGAEGRATDRLGRPSRWDPPATAPCGPRAPRPTPRSPGSSRSRRPRPAAARRSASRDWERWLEFCARIDGFPRHLSIHSGGMLVTAAPLIDIAPIERATMVDRVVVQFDKRDVETLKLIKLDLLGLGMLAAMDETLQLIEHDCAVCLDLDRLPGGRPGGVRDAPGGRHGRGLPGREPGPDADAPQVTPEEPRRPRGRGGDHPAGPDPGQRRPPVPASQAGPGARDLPAPDASSPILKDSMGVILYQEQVMRIAIEVGGFTAGRIGRVPAGDGDVALEQARWRSSTSSSSMAACASPA